jgi:regulatory protein
MKRRSISADEVDPEDGDSSNRMAEDAVAVRNSALNLLARRDHSRYELQQKLLRRGFAGQTIDTVLALLVDEQLLDEMRYAESYTRMRAEKGYGPLRIRMELRERGIETGVIARILADYNEIWSDKLEYAHDKRFGRSQAADSRERGRRMRFLQQRGFSADQINRFLNGLFK